MRKAETVRIDDRLLGKIRQAVDAALSYEKATKGTRTQILAKTRKGNPTQ